MSTRIANTFILNHADIGRAVEETVALRPAAQALLRRVRSRNFAFEVRKYLTQVYRYGHKSDKNPLAFAYAVEREERKEASFPGSAWDGFVQVLLFMTPRSVLGQVWGPERSGIVAWVREQLGAESFDYYDHTDRPKKISEADWEIRRRLWDMALGDHGVPIDAAVSVQLSLSHPLVPTADEVLAELGTREDVIEKLAEKITFDDRYAAREAVARPRNTVNISRMMNNKESAKTWLESPEGKAAVVEERIRLDKRLPKVFDAAMLSHVPESARCEDA